MIERLNKRKRERVTYPAQFWLLFWGAFINRGSVSMMWPFLTVYLRQHLDVSLTTITLLLTVRAVFSVASTAITSTLMDRIGRKWVMLVSIFLSALVFVGMAFGDSLLDWMLLLAAHGMVLPVFNNGVSTVVADIVPPENRGKGYAMIRSVSNAGIAVVPLIGGAVALVSLQAIFLASATVYIVLAILGIFLLSETKPQGIQPTTNNNRFGGYDVIFRDRRFMGFVVGYMLALMGVSQMFSLLPVYTAENFGLLETEYSLFLSVNAAMVVLFQYVVTRYTERFPSRYVVTVGAMVYTLGIMSVIPASTLLHFTLAMVIFTLGELIFEPTALKFVADLAPDDMRARYLGVLSLGYPLGSGLGPVLGGILNDNVAPVAIWYGATAFSLVGVVVFFVLARQDQRKNISLASA
ncbi:MAG: MFS transporter [Anaerolineae bacterium]|nr:MFS transporter [Anaerolineae bacterium]